MGMLDAVEQLTPLRAPLVAFDVNRVLLLTVDAGKDAEGEGGEDGGGSEAEHEGPGDQQAFGQHEGIIGLATVSK
jgi:hypothetical protein